MLKQSNDSFNLNENIASNQTEAMVEGEVYIPDEKPEIDKIVYTGGKVKINNVSVLTNKVTVYGELDYNMIYRSNNEENSVSGTHGKFDFMEEVAIPNITEKMTADVKAELELINPDMISERKCIIKAVVNLNVDVNDTKNIDYISAIESDGSFQAKTNVISYTDLVNTVSSDFTMNDSLVLEPNMDEIQEVLKIDIQPEITETDVMNERMLIEGKCMVNMLYVERNDFCTCNTVSKEFPFTHYIEMKNISDEAKNNMEISVKNYDYQLEKDDNDENKIVNITINMVNKANVYDTVSKNIIVDGYSTTNMLDMQSNEVTLPEIKGFKNITQDFEKAVDLEDANVKDIYSVDMHAKISEKNIYEDSIVIDGFIESNIVYLNNDFNKIDGTMISEPFTITENISDLYPIDNVDVSICVNNPSAYRKGSGTILLNAQIGCKLCYKCKKKANIISGIQEGEKLSNNKMPSLIFRVVQPNETLWDIAKNYNVSMNYVTRLNELEANAPLVEGSKIIIAKQV